MKRILSLFLLLSLVLTAWAAAPDLKNFETMRTYRSGQFADVAAGAWYEQSVAAAYELALMQGTAPGRFTPEGALSVAEALALACRVHSVYWDQQPPQGEGAPWYQSYETYGRQNGLMEEGFVVDERAASRAQFAQLLSAALPEAALEQIGSVPDDAIPDVAMTAPQAAAIYRLYRAGVLTGSDEVGTFEPQSAIDRASAAAVVTRMARPALRRAVTLYAPVEGAIGKSVRFRLVGDTMTVTGSGAIDDMAEDHSAWEQCADRVKKLVIGSGVTAVGKHAFQSLENLTDLSVSGTVQTIDNYAFAGCRNLRFFSLPEGLKVLGYGAFESAPAEGVVLPTTLSWIGGDAFAAATGQSVVFIAGNAPTLADKYVFGRGETPQTRAQIQRYDTSYGWVAPAWADYRVRALPDDRDSAKPYPDATGVHAIVTAVNQGLAHLSQAGEQLVASGQAADALSAVQRLAAARNLFVASYQDFERGVLWCGKYRGVGALKGSVEAIMCQLAAMKDVSFTTETYLPHLNEFVQRYVELEDELAAVGTQLRQLAQ